MLLAWAVGLGVWRSAMANVRGVHVGVKYGGGGAFWRV